LLPAPHCVAATSGFPGATYNDEQSRNEEKELAEQAERAYQVFVAHWQATKPTGTRAPV